MNITLVKDSIRNITKQLVSYLSVVIIAMLAATIFLSINYSSRTIQDNADRYYDSSNYRDLEISFLYPADQEIIDMIGAISEVSDAEGVLQSTCIIRTPMQHAEVDVLSLTERINTPIVLEGRIPEADNECIIEKTLAERLKIQIGDKVTFSEPNGDPVERLKINEFIVTGFMYHGDTACYEEDAVGNRYVLIKASAFDNEGMNGMFNKALLKFNGTEGLSRLGNDYLKKVDETREKIAPELNRICELAYNNVADQYRAVLYEKSQELDAAKLELDNARRRLDEGWEELATSEEKLTQAEGELKDGEQELADARATLDDSQKLIDQAEQELNDAYRELQSSLNSLQNGEAQIARKKAELDAANRKLTDARKQLDEAEELLATYSQQLSDGRTELAEARQKLDDAYVTLTENQAELDSHTDQFNQVKAELEASTDRINQIRTPVATILHKAMKFVIGDTADRFDWSQLEVPLDIEDPDATLSNYILTEDVAIDLTKPLSYNISSLLSLLSLTDDQWGAIYRATTGAPDELPSGYDSWKALAASKIADKFLELYPGYNDLVQDVTDWENGHKAVVAYLAASAELEEGWNKYYAALDEYNEGSARLDELQQEYDQGVADYNSGLADYNSGLSEYNSGLAQYRQARNKLDRGWAQYNSARAEYDRANDEFKSKKAEFDEGMAEYESGLARYEEGLAEYNDGLAQAAAARAELEEQENKYEDGYSEYESASAAVEEKLDLLQMYNNTKMIFGMQENASYNIIYRCSHNLKDIGMTFSLVFIIVAALVIYATLGRIVEEQRKQVGTTKALGFYNREIIAKYMIFGLSGTVIGMGIGVFLGYKIVQPIVMKGYAQNFVYGAGEYAFVLPLTLIVLVFGIVLSALTILFACTELIKSPAVILLADKTPPFIRNKSNKSTTHIYTKLLILNMLSDKKRVIATIASVLGCCTLLCAGFTIRFAVEHAVVNQFKEYEKYDYKIKVNKELSENADDQVRSLLEIHGASFAQIEDKFILTQFEDRMTSMELVCGDLDAVDSFFTLNDAKTGDHLLSSTEGIWIHKKMSEYYHLSPGDPLTIYYDSMEPYTTKVAGVYENYIGYYAFIDTAYYETLFGHAPSHNCFFVNYNKGDITPLSIAINAVPGLEEFKSSAKIAEDYKEQASALDAVSLLCIVMAALLAYFILLNLVAMLLHQKKREIITMRINGFSLGQTIGYISSEFIASTVLGIIGGLLCGSLLGYIILNLIESDQIRFDRSIQWTGWLLSALITAIFMVLICVPTLRKIKFFKLSDMTSA
ncbi:Predicted membrane protein [Ruminococcaceae bacterium YRB3002]|nr:Predicted membrane protein [Ruminococcaceae bacterium YRB3002]